MPFTYDPYHKTSYPKKINAPHTNDAAGNYYARLSEKAAPPGTIHFNNDIESSYRQPVCYNRAPTERVVRKVVHVRESSALPTHVIQEKVVVREPVQQPPREVVREVERNVVHDMREKNEAERKVEERREMRERGFVRNVTEKGAGAVWKALGGQSRTR